MYFRQGIHERDEFEPKHDCRISWCLRTQRMCDLYLGCASMWCSGMEAFLVLSLPSLPWMLYAARWVEISSKTKTRTTVWTIPNNVRLLAISDSCNNTCVFATGSPTNYDIMMVMARDVWQYNINMFFCASWCETMSMICRSIQVAECGLPADGVLVVVREGPESRTSAWSGRFHIDSDTW